MSPGMRPAAEKYLLSCKCQKGLILLTGRDETMAEKKGAIDQTLLKEWLENPYWQEYYEQAPSEKCRELIALEFMYSEFGTDEIIHEMEEVEKELCLVDWQHLYRYCGNNPRKKMIRDRIRELGGEIR